MTHCYVSVRSCRRLCANIMWCPKPPLGMRGVVRPNDAAYWLTQSVAACCGRYADGVAARRCVVHKTAASAIYQQPSASGVGELSVLQRKAA